MEKTDAQWELPDQIHLDDWMKEWSGAVVTGQVRELLERVQKNAYAAGYKAALYTLKASEAVLGR